MKFEIADWRFEVTWDGLLLQPIKRGRANGANAKAAVAKAAVAKAAVAKAAVAKAAVAKAAKKNVPQPDRRAAAASAQPLGLAVQTFNKQRTRKGATK
jgi:hypothetical protein